MMNYHELTMNEPRDSPQRRKQFLVISAIMVGMTLHAGLSAGVLATLDITEGQFPGGEFVYKFMTKDYAASTGALRTVASDLGISEEGNGNLIIQEGETMDTADMLYSVLLDDQRVVPGGKTRFASGLLVAKSNKRGGDMKKALLAVNDDIKKEGGTHSRDVRYEVGSLPKVNAAMASHPFTAGAWSAVLQTYKIIPKFKQYAVESGKSDNPVVIATCSAKQQMCTYYMPLVKREKFYMGRALTEDYSKEFDGAGTLARMGIKFDPFGGLSGMTIGGVNVGKVVRGLKRAVGLGGAATKGGDDEL